MPTPRHTPAFNAWRGYGAAAIGFLVTGGAEHIPQGRVAETAVQVWSRTALTSDRRKPVRKPDARNPSGLFPSSTCSRISCVPEAPALIAGQYDRPDMERQDSPVTR